MAKAKHQKVSSLALKRSYDTFTASWSYPSGITKSGNKNYCAKVQIKWSGCGSSSTTYSGIANHKSISWKPSNLSYSTGITVKVRLYHKKKKGWGSWQTKTFKLDKGSSSWGTPSLNVEATKISCESTSDADTDNAHHWVRRDLSMTRKKHLLTGDSETVAASWTANCANTSYTCTYDEKEMQTLKKGEYLAYRFKAIRRGHSGTTEAYSSWKYIGWAIEPTIDGVDADLANNQVIVHITAPWKAERPTDKLQLQYAVVTTSYAAMIPEDEWKDLESYGNANDKALATSCTTIKATESGYKCWVRVKATNEVEAFTSWSNPYHVTALDKIDDSLQPLDASTLAIIGADAQADGTTIALKLGWNDAKYNGNETSYSDYVNSWTSNKDPSSFQLPDQPEDEGPVTVGEITYEHTRTVYVVDLDEATPYYFRARRYAQDDDSHTAWTDISTCTTGTSPAGVTVTVDRVVATGYPLNVYWLCGGSNPQLNWQVQLDGNTVAAGDGTATVYQIPAETLEGLETATIRVGASTDGTSWYWSHEEGEGALVRIRQIPTVTVDTSQTITAKGHAYTFTAEVGTVLSYRLLACGVTSKAPDDSNEQYSGEVVCSGTLVSTTGTVTLNLPDDVNLIDGAQYYLEVIPTNDGLMGDTVIPSWTVGEEVSTRQTVAWSHQAVAPSESLTTIEVDAGALTATITPGKPDGYWLASGDLDAETAYYTLADGVFTACEEPTQDMLDAGLLWYFEGYAEGDSWADTDVFDVYRSTPDGVSVLAEGVKLGQSVIDRWAPYGGEGNEYVVCTRTQDGDMAWTGYDYALESKAVRFDWGNENVAMLYNIELDDSWEKDFEGRKYLDGTKDGWWNKGAERSMSVSADLNSLEGAEAETALRSMAQYAGEVFVRTPEGLAFAANVELSKLSTTYSSRLVGTSFDIEEVRCQDHLAGASEIVTAGSETE